MKNCRLLWSACCLLFSFTASGQCRLVTLPTPANYNSILSDYQIVFNDEFDYDRNNLSTFWNNSPWSFVPHPGLQYPDVFQAPGTETLLERHDATQATIVVDPINSNNQFLRLRAEKLPNTINYPVPALPPGQTRDIMYKSGMVTFKQEFFTNQAQYDANTPPGFLGVPTMPTQPQYETGYSRGIFEIRCKMPAAASTYQAFWMWAGVNEFDIFEGDQDNKTTLFNNVHCNTVIPHRACQSGYTKQSVGRLDEDFHTYTMAWTPEFVTFFFDGREIRTIVNGMDGISLHPNCANIIINLSIPSWANTNDGTWSTDPTGVRYTDMLVDYVRIYQPKQAAGVPRTANNYEPTYPSYKTDYGWKRTDLEAPALPALPDPDREITQALGCVSTSKLSGQVAYSGTDGVLRRYYPTGGGAYAYEKIAPNGGWQWYMNIKGDITIVDDALGQHVKVFYKGVDNRVHYIYQDAGSWHHDWAVPRDASGTLLWGDPVLSNQPGALAVANGGSLLFYRGTDNRVHKMEWQPAPVVGWEYSILPFDAYLGATEASQLVDGDIITDGAKVYYVGADEHIQCYWINPLINTYTHIWIDTDWSSSTTSLVSNAYGALCNHPSGLVYRGRYDNLVHNFYYDSGWHHQYLTQNTDQWLVPIVGKLDVASNGTIFYRGRDSKLQHYYKLGNDWIHAWPDGWGYLSPKTVTTDNFSIGSTNAPIFFQNSANFMSYFEWAQCETRRCIASNVIDPVRSAVYRPTRGGKVLSASPGSAATHGDGRELGLYPNPAKNQVTITSKVSVPVQVVLLDVTGRTVLSRVVAGGETQMKLDQLRPGAYTVRLRQGQSVSHRRLVIVE